MLNRNFQLSDLKNGFIVELDNELKFKVMGNNLVQVDLHEIIENYTVYYSDALLHCAEVDYDIVFVWNKENELVYSRNANEQCEKMINYLYEVNIHSVEELKEILTLTSNENNDEEYKTHCEEFGCEDIFKTLEANEIYNMTDLEIIITELIDLRERVEELEDELDKYQDYDNIEEQRDDYQRALNKINDILQCTDF